MEGKLRHFLKPSWLVRMQVGAKMAKLTVLGGLRGTKLELEGALGFGGAQRGSKRAQKDTGEINKLQTCCNWSK